MIDLLWKSNYIFSIWNRQQAIIEKSDKKNPNPKHSKPIHKMEIHTFLLKVIIPIHKL